MKNNLKTTICGAAIAAMTAIGAYQGHNWKGYAAAAGVALFGYFAKDAE